MRFAAWLAQQSDRDDPIGDLARDALADGFRTGGPGTLARRLLEAGALDKAHQALQRAEREFILARIGYYP